MKLECNIESTSAVNCCLLARLNTHNTCTGNSAGLPLSDIPIPQKETVLPSQWIGPKIRMNFDSRGVMLHTQLNELRTDQGLYCDTYMYVCLCVDYAWPGLLLDAVCYVGQQLIYMYMYSICVVSPHKTPCDPMYNAQQILKMTAVTTGNIL